MWWKQEEDVEETLVHREDVVASVPAAPALQYRRGNQQCSSAPACTACAQGLQSVSSAGMQSVRSAREGIETTPQH